MNGRPLRFELYVAPDPQASFAFSPSGHSIYDTVQFRDIVLGGASAVGGLLDDKPALGAGEGWSPPGLRRSGDTGGRGRLGVSNLRKGDSP
jgi:hypothetical protein